MPSGLIHQHDRVSAGATASDTASGGRFLIAQRV
jgi:hypothetical protein